MRVAVASAEAPQAVLDAADVVVASPDEFLALLRRLLISGLGLSERDTSRCQAPGQVRMAIGDEVRA